MLVLHDMLPLSRDLCPMLNLMTLVSMSISLHTIIGDFLIGLIRGYFLE